MSDSRCKKHSWEASENECRECRFAHCADCLVYINGPNKPPLCVTCALSIAGVRKGGRGRPRVGPIASLREQWADRRRGSSDNPSGPKAVAPVPTHDPSWASLDSEVWDVDPNPTTKSA